MEFYIAIILLVVVFLLVIPIDVQVFAERDRVFTSSVSIIWLFRVVRVRMHFTPTYSRAEKARALTQRAFRLQADKVAQYFIIPELRIRTLRFLGKLLYTLRPQDVRIWARVGMNDPAETGWLCAVLGPITTFFSPASIDIEPNFQQACFQFRASAHVRLIPAQLLVVFGDFLFSALLIQTVRSR